MPELIIIPIKPITVNQAWKGEKYKTPKYKQWRQDVCCLVPRRKKLIKWCKIELDFYIKYYSMTDVDNLIKPTLDALQEVGVLEDDKYVVSVLATKHKMIKEEKIILQIHELESM